MRYQTLRNLFILAPNKIVHGIFISHAGLLLFFIVVSHSWTFYTIFTNGGLDAFEEFYPEVRKFYDFSKFELQHVYGDGDHVFAIIKAGIANTNDKFLLCKHITFKEGKIVEVQLFIYDFPQRKLNQQFH